MIALLFFALAVKSYAQSNILITYNSGSDQTYSVSATGKLYFDSDNLMVQTSEASPATSISTSLIRKVTFFATALPLKLIEFALRNEKSQISLNWKTLNEINTSHFIIERSTSGVGYEAIGQVTALNISTGGSYNFIDQSPKSGISYYRLKQIDTDGKYVYSNVLSVNRSATNSLVLLPNPAINYLTISSNTSEKLNVKIYSVAGQLLLYGSYLSGEQIAVDKLTPGLYVVLINDKSYKFIKE